VQLCTWSQINFGDLTPYLTYGFTKQNGVTDNSLSTFYKL
jgi:hypothetical protein